MNLQHTAPKIDAQDGQGIKQSLSDIWSNPLERQNNGPTAASEHDSEGSQEKPLSDCQSYAQKVLHHLCLQDLPKL